MAIGALNLLVLFLVVRKTAAPGSVFRLFNPEKSYFAAARRRETDTNAADK